MTITTQTQLVTIPFADPNGRIQFPQRAIAGAVKWITVTVDSYYGPGIYATQLYVGVTGDVEVMLWDGTTVVFKAMPVGLYNICSMMIPSASTTATTMLAGY